MRVQSTVSLASSSPEQAPPKASRTSVCDGRGSLPFFGGGSLSLAANYRGERNTQSAPLLKFAKQNARLSVVWGCGALVLVEGARRGSARAPALPNLLCLLVGHDSYARVRFLELNLLHCWMLSSFKTFIKGKKGRTGNGLQP